MNCCICNSNLVYYSKAYFYNIEYDYAYFCKMCNYYTLESTYIVYNKYWSNKGNIIDFYSIFARIDENNIIYFKSNHVNMQNLLHQFDEECLFEERLKFTIKFVNNIEFM